LNSSSVSGRSYEHSSSHALLNISSCRGGPRARRSRFHPSTTESDECTRASAAPAPWRLDGARSSKLDDAVDDRDLVEHGDFDARRDAVVVDSRERHESQPAVSNSRENDASRWRSGRRSAGDGASVSRAISTGSGP